ncbi:MAG: VTT domain-containing protein [Myxococcota bacterium]|nr:VTT domain-containing protein [Myxococcota bacterium]
MFEKIIEYVQDAHPIYYFGLLMLAGLGIPVSEDGLNVWTGGLLGREQAPYGTLSYVIALYAGVACSDMLTFFLGRCANRAFGKSIRKFLFRDPAVVEKAMISIRKHGDMAGFVQRFSLGARLPISFFSGYCGISAPKFFLGVCAGAAITLPLQLSLGYLMRNQIQHVLDFLVEYGSLVGLLILVGLGFVVFRFVRRDVKMGL